MKRLLFLLLLVPGLLEAQTVTITGDGAATTVELTGPTGQTGQTGSIGPTGPQGPAGPAGGTYEQVLFSALGTPADGTSYFCTDCLETDPCAGSGTGAFAFRVGSVWSCAKGGTGNMADPGADGFMARTAVDTSVARTLTSPLGTLALGNATGVAGNPTLDVDSSIIGQFSSGTGTAPATCVLGDIYYETDTGFVTPCPNTDTPNTLIGKAETSTAGYGFVIDEDSFASDSATKVPTQQSVKAYVTANSGGGYKATSLTLFDDFLGGGTTTGTIGETGAQFVIISTGTVVKNQAPPFFFRLNSHVSNDNSGVDMYLGPGGPWSTAFTATDWAYTIRVIPGSNATSIASAAIYFGVSRSTPQNTGANNGWIGILYDTDVAAGTWMFTTCNANGAAGCASAADAANAKVTASTISPTAGTAAVLKIRHAVSGIGGNETYYLSVDGEAEKTFCSAGCDDTFFNQAANVASLMLTYVTRTTTGVMSADLDYMILDYPSFSR
jgi:hypothetical protein